ncbi:hypothetical protein Bca101_082703 [Brassica carinata]
MITLKQEDWDDSKVRSPISKSRIQSRIEAMEKRERALAYAFSQQKKQIDRSSEDEYNNSWSWLERWTTTRVPDCNPLEHQTNIQGDVQRLARKNMAFSMAGELESCASSDLPPNLKAYHTKRGNRIFAKRKEQC